MTRHKSSSVHVNVETTVPISVVMVLVAACPLAGCQSNAAGRTGYRPTGCGMVGSSCDSGR